MTVEFFNDQSDPQAQMPPTQTAVLKQLIQSFGQQLRVGLPGKIVSYDYKTQLATVQPSFSNQYSDGTVSPMPQIFNVPIQIPSSSNSYTHHPVSVGDHCMIHFADKSLDLWLQNGATSAPNDNRTHHVADAWAVMGGRPTSNPAPVSNNQDLINEVGASQLRQKPSGQLQLFNGLGTASSLELFSLLNQFMQAVISNDMSGAASIQQQFKNFVVE